MIAIDTNLLIYAHRSRTPEHARARKAIERAARAAAGWGIAAPSLTEFWAIATHPASEERPSTPTQAAAFVAALVKAGAQIWLPGPGFGDRLLQVASNLVGNAVHHGSAERGVEVRVDGTKSAHLTIAICNGGLIPDALMPHVFEPFQSGEVRSHRSGLGLGLFISKEIVAAHRGTLSVASKADTTTFTIVLPRGGSAAAAPA